MPLAEHGDRAAYWLGVPDDTAFRCNAYLIRDGETALIADPGGRQYFERLRDWVADILPDRALAEMVLSHQVPDETGSMVEWLRLNPEMTVFSTPCTQVLLPQCAEQTARAAAERVRAVGEERTSVTISLGVVVCEGEPCAADGLIEAAERALYQAKDGGSNCVMMAP
ncbi:MAG: diguanylate cyclase domain-containing protein [Pseudomonadota bacterium]